MPRTATKRHFLMCRPTYFDVSYAINPWMDFGSPVDRNLTIVQWEELRITYERLGHRVDLIEPVPELPDMVFAANGAFVVDGGYTVRSSATRSVPTRRQRTGPGSRPPDTPTFARRSTSTKARVISPSPAI